MKWIRTRAVKVFGTMAVLACIAGIAQAAESGRGWLLPESISAEGDEIDRLFWFIFAVTGVVFLLTEGALLYFIFKYRTRPGQKAFHTHGSHKLEVIWTIIPAVILAILAIAQTGTWLKLKSDKAIRSQVDGGAMEVHVLAQQYAWKFRYPGADGKFGTSDDFQSGELHLIQGRPTVLRMRSLDVIHSLFLPNLRFKNDVVPGIEVSGWVEPRKTGRYPIVCAELCGPQHYTMKSYFNVHSESEWTAKQAALASTGTIDYGSETETLRWWPIQTNE